MRRRPDDHAATGAAQRDAVRGTPPPAAYTGAVDLPRPIAMIRSVPLALFPRVASLAALLVGLVSADAGAATYQVGPGRTHTSLNALFSAVDLDEVDGGGVEYAGQVIMPAADGGAPGNPVTLRGIKTGGLRPILRGGVNTIELRANHVVVESFEIVGTTTPTRTFRCFFHHSHDVVIRDAWIHDCPDHGVLGADQDSGSLTIEYSEISHSGSGTQNHTIYMATDEVAYPGAVFRLQHSWVHGATGGNLIKSRAERNEIRYNWLEGGVFHELELIGPDPGGAPPGWSEGLVREDSDVVGNVVVHTSTVHGSVFRFGGDGTGQSRGRYRVVNNTILRRGASNLDTTVFRLFDGIESVEMHNNVIHREGGHALRLIREVEAQWTFGSRIAGSHNYYDAGATFVPAAWSNSRTGTTPGFADIASLDLRLAESSSLRDSGGPAISTADYQIASPETIMRFHPARALQAIGAAASRQQTGSAVEPGAFELSDPTRVFRSGFEAGESAAVLR
jgi:hypothetical protein